MLLIYLLRHILIKYKNPLCAPLSNNPHDEVYKDKIIISKHFFKAINT